MSYVNHQLLKPNILRKRKYQIDIFITCTKSNCLVVVPTGLGKTIVALLLSIHQIQKFDGKIIFLAPTRPLIEQHLNTFISLTNIPEEELCLLTGSTLPEKRKQKYQENTKVFFMTPQVLQNDLISNRIQLEDVSLMIFDEAHRATGNYAYTFLAKKYMALAKQPKILAMTASPGKNREIINEVIENLYLNTVEIRIDSDPDVKPYIQEVETIWKDVELPEEMKEIKTTIEGLQSQLYNELKKQNILESADRTKITRRNLLLASGKIDSDVSKPNAQNDIPRLLFCKKLLTNGIRLSHIGELLETQGLNALQKYLHKNIKEVEQGKGGKSLRELFNSLPIQNMVAMVDHLITQQVDHPKVASLMETLVTQFQDNPQSRILVFCHFRNTVEFIEQLVNKNELVRAQQFIGQQKKGKQKGLSQKEQLAILQNFKDGKINTLIATSVAEEGLDISECDVVIFYDVVPSEIRAIQRRGRTGRNSKGKVIIFKTVGTREEGYFWAEQHRERKMKTILKQIQSELAIKQPSKSEVKGDSGQKTMTAFLKKKKEDADPEQESTEKTIVKEQNPNNLQNQEYIPQPVEIFDDKEPVINLSSKISPNSSEYPNSFYPYIVIDTRETASPVTREISELGARISLEKLTIGDYIVSERCGIERKSIEDFTASLKDGRLFNELNNLRTQFSHPILILEGNLRSAFSMNRAAIMGALTSIVLNMQILLYQAIDPTETAEFVYALAKKEQEKAQKPKFSIRFKKIPENPRQKLEYIISGLPGINASRAQDLLRHFRTLQNIFNASEADLKEVSNIGPIIAQSIRKYANLDYYLEKQKEDEEKNHELDDD